MCARVRGKACARASERHRARASEYERKYGQRLQLTNGTQTHTQAHRHTDTQTGRQRERMGEARLQRHRHNGTHDTQLYIHVQVRTKSTRHVPIWRPNARSSQTIDTPKVAISCSVATVQSILLQLPPLFELILVTHTSLHPIIL